jgi:hypothetical protein
MSTLALALPCLPGGADKLRQLAEQCRGPRHEEFAGFHQRAGLDIERWYLQQTPQGELFVLYLDGDPLGAIGMLAASDHPFDVWFREQAKQIHGIDFSQPLPAPPPEVVFEG